MPSSLDLLFLSLIQWRVLIRAWYTRETCWRIREFSWLDRRSKGIIRRLIPPPLFSLRLLSFSFWERMKKTDDHFALPDDTPLSLLWSSIEGREVCLECDCYTWNACLSIRLWFSHEIKSWREIRKNDINTYHSFHTSITWEEEECLARTRSLIKSGIWGKGEKMNQN